MERGLQSVRQALWLLRKALGEDFLEASETVRINPGVLTSDVADLKQALAEDRVGDAAALWNGPFLHRFAVADAPEWDRWVESVHEDLSGRLSSALFASAAGRRDSGDAAGARRALERAVEVSPYEPRYREELVTFLVELRDLRSAEKALAEARQAVEAPEQQESLERLVRRVEELRADRVVVPDERFARPDLVGRSAELADLMVLWRRTEKGEKRVALLTGPAGIGKTRLADELARTVQHEGAATVTVRAAEAEQPMEYGVVASLVRALLQMSGSAGISTASDVLLRGLAPSLPVRRLPDGEDEPERVNPAGLSDALADLIGAIAWERPLLITVDDAGWADASSVTIFARALRTLREGPVMVVLTARTSGGVGEVLRPLETIGGDVAFSTIRLRPLSRRETHELVALLVDLPEGTGVQRLLDRIHTTTAGNPFYVIELIRAFLDERLVVAEDGQLVLDLPRLDDAVPWPKNVRALVRRRFERLTPQARALGHLLATVTPREPETAARRLAGLGRRAYAMAVGELIEHGIVVWDGNSLVFTHAELREAAAAWVDETVPAPRRLPFALILGGLAVVAVAAWSLLRASGVSATHAAPEDPPYGGGEIILPAGDSIVSVSPRRDGDSVVWRVSDPREPVPSPDRLVGIYRTVAGRMMWFRATQPPDRGPDIVEVNPVTGDETPIITGADDDALYAISPDGAWLLYGSNDPATDYDPGLFVARSDGTEQRRLWWGRRGADWSRDGRFILAVAPSALDTLLVLTPRGRLVAARTGRRITGYFCGASDRIAFADLAGQLYRLGIWEWRTDSVRLFPENVARLDGCSPDGRAALVELVRGLRERTGVLDLETGEFHDIDVAAGRSWTRPAWLRDDRVPVAARLILDTDSVAVAWGAADSIGGRLILSDSSTRTPDIEWSSADSSVATVSSAGILRGNRPGSTRVTGCVDDWICDSLFVDVRGEQGQDILFEDRFPDALDRQRWIPFGQPIPRVVSAPGGERVLFLNGDGVWLDGVLSRKAFSLSRGATLEVGFRFRGGFTRTDHQRVTFCLLDYDLESDTVSALPGLEQDEHTRGGVCLVYPSDELQHFDPLEAYFFPRPSATGNYVRLPDDFPPLQWTQLAIQVQSDGAAFLIVNRTRVAQLSVRLENTAVENWRVVLAGHSVGTHLEVRYVTLWRGSQF